MATSEGFGNLHLALALLRKAAGHDRHADLAESMDVDVKTVGRLEKTGANPRWSTLTGRLSATGNNLFDLAVALRVAGSGEADLPPGEELSAPERWDLEIAWLARELLDARHEVRIVRRENAVLREKLVALEEAFHKHRDEITLKILEGAAERTKEAPVKRTEPETETEDPNSSHD